MQTKTPVVDYKKLRLNNINSDTYKHLLWLLFWPIYGLMFLFVERFYPVDSYYEMHCWLDDIIPFCEWFLIPYLFWFFFIIGMHIYTLLYDVDAFERMMKYIAITYTIAIVIYLLFPTCQHLRPETFARDNALTRFTAFYYKMDTCTNVCPSIHVIGSLAIMSTALYTKTIKSKTIKIGFVVSAILISISTVFMKQHSTLDILAALPVCFIGYFFSFSPKRSNRLLNLKTAERV